MAIDINEQVSNAYTAAKQALNDDLKQQLYSATQARNEAYRKINNNANAQHAMFSGVPTGGQMQYDAGTYLPSIASMATTAMEKYKSNQENWDQYMAYIKQLNDQAAYYNSQAAKLKSATGHVGTSNSGFTEDMSASSSFASGGR